MRFDAYEDYPVTATVYTVVSYEWANGQALYGATGEVSGRFVTSSQMFNTVFITRMEDEIDEAAKIGFITDRNGRIISPEFFDIQRVVPVVNVYGIAEGVSHVLRVDDNFAQNNLLGA